MSAAARSCVLYARVSTDTGDQDPESQLRALREFAAQRGYTVLGEYSDRVTGDPARRRGDPPGLCQALRLLEQRRGGVLVIWAADRLVRSAVGLLQLVGRVQQLGGAVVSLQDGGDLDTTTDTGELLVFLRGWMARMEARIIRERTMAGLARARAEGRKGGRRPIAVPTNLELCAAELAIKSRGLEPTLQRIASELGVSMWAVRRAKNPGLKSRGSSDGTAAAPGAV